MNCIKCFAAAVLLAGLTAPVDAAEFEVSYLDGGSWNSIYAQGFSPSVEPSPNLGLDAGATATLTEFSFFKSGNADNASDIKLAIISPFFANIQGMNTGSAFLVGLSDNTISGTAGIATGDPISFTFGSGLDLTYGNNYAAVFVTQSGNALTPALVPALVANYVESPPGSGTFVPETNYGTDSQFDYAVSNFITSDIFGSFFNTFSFAADANFRATFTAIPEPATGLMGVGCLGPLVLGRKRRG